MDPQAGVGVPPAMRTTRYPVMAMPDGNDRLRPRDLDLVGVLRRHGGDNGQREGRHLGGSRCAALTAPVRPRRTRHGPRHDNESDGQQPSDRLRSARSASCGWAHTARPVPVIDRGKEAPLQASWFVVAKVDEHVRDDESGGPVGRHHAAAGPSRPCSRRPSATRRDSPPPTEAARSPRPTARRSPQSLGFTTVMTSEPGSPRTSGPLGSEARKSSDLTTVPSTGAVRSTVSPGDTSSVPSP